MIQSKSKFRGIVRNKINELNQLKGRKKSPSKRFSKSALRKTIEDETMMRSNLLSEDTRSSQVEMTTVEPGWMVGYKECCELLKEVQMLQKEISKEKLKKMSAVYEKKHDRVIQHFAEQATVKLNKCEKKLKQIERAASFDGQIPPAEKRTMTNMLIAMATNIRDQARKLRGQQQSELRRQRQLKDSTKNILDIKTQSSQTENWLSQEQFESLQVHMMKERDEQVTKIVQSIYSLNSIYKELQTLVIEQGSLLDRIDQNIQNSVQKVSQARKHLEEAKDRQESSCLKRTRRTLIMLIMVCLLIFFIKHI